MTIDREMRELERQLIHATVARLRAGILAIVFAGVGATTIFLATALLLVQGGPQVGKHLALLSHYLPGYSVTWLGAVVGMFWGAVIGAVIGGAFAWIYNVVSGWREPG